MWLLFILAAGALLVVIFGLAGIIATIGAIVDAI